ncbi:MAG TPA: hypothetical protein VN611_14905 [Patescibacteria group bacterium]|nr:hypothetical protein [Patescibacteria group bacterium]
MSDFENRLNKLLPDLLGAEVAKACRIRRNIIELLIVEGRRLLQETPLPERWHYIAASDDEDDEKAFRLVLAVLGDPSPDVLRLFENLTEYEAEYWIRYQQQIEEEWKSILRVL